VSIHLLYERMTGVDGQQFKKTLKDFYKESARDLPWRRTSNPYHIVISEVMLQQTQVPRVIEKYGEFLKTFPSWRALANASFAEVLEVWSGLGYNRRAKYLHEIAQKVIHEHDGTLPSDPIILETFPGIGKATASSVAVYAFNEPHVFIETNVRRVFIHHFFSDASGVDDKDIAPLVEKTLDHENPKEWYWALMDYGTYLASTIENPNRKSKHYAKQSKFEGSVRKVRGEILRQLIKYKSLTEKELFAQEESIEKVQAAISGLLKDNLVLKKKNIYHLS
jgi:A/G-specific adenine glycosylase